MLGGEVRRVASTDNSLGRIVAERPRRERGRRAYAFQVTRRQRDKQPLDSAGRALLEVPRQRVSVVVVQKGLRRSDYLERPMNER